VFLLPKRRLNLDLVGAIDAGGTSWRCAIVDRTCKIVARTAFATTTPEETLAKASAFFVEHSDLGFMFDKIGIACFGPLGVNPQEPRWGHILTTTKAGWSGTNVAGALAQSTKCRILIDTDVNAAALAERAWGAGQGRDDLAYVTVGTGIGAGILLDGKPIWGAMHPEAGHMRVPRHRDDPDFEGVCPFHGDCVEGLASAPALKRRWGMEASQLPDDHAAWDIEAHYLAHLGVNLVLTTAVPRVIFGGGVMARRGLTERVAAKAKALMGPYGLAAQGEAGFDVVSAGLGLDAGLLGGAWLAQVAL
jgi:fructokinase